MPNNRLPIPLIQSAMRAMPPQALHMVVGIIVCRIKRRHPKLFQNLARLRPAIVQITPTDLPFQFALQLGPAPDFTLITSSVKSPDAKIAGDLETLVNMLEARADGDTMFFERGITISGDTSVIVALRNTLDREEINLIDDIMSFWGPLSKPATAAFVIADRLASRLREKTNEA